MRFAAAFCAAISALLLGTLPSRAGDMDTGVPPFVTLVVTTKPTMACAMEKTDECANRMAAGNIALIFGWRYWCPQTLCLFPDSIQIERNGSLVATVPFKPNGEHLGGWTYVLFVAQAGWDPGDCFRLRGRAPAAGSDPSKLLYSAYTDKACVPKAANP